MHNYIREKEWNDSYVQFGFICSETTEGLKIKHCMFFNTVFSNANLKPSDLQDHFKIRLGEANVSGHDVKSLKAKRIRFESRKTFPKLGFLFAGKPLLMALNMWRKTYQSPRRKQLLKSL